MASNAPADTWFPKMDKEVNETKPFDFSDFEESLEKTPEYVATWQIDSGSRLIHYIMPILITQTVSFIF